MSYIKEGKMEKNNLYTYPVRISCLQKSQYEQSENNGHVIISEKEKHKINISQM